MRWHNGRTRRSPNPNPEEVLRDCVTNGERSAAHSILARSFNSNKGRIHLRRPTRTLTFRLRQGGGPYIPSCPPYFRSCKERLGIHYQYPTGTPRRSHDREFTIARTFRASVLLCRGSLCHSDNTRRICTELHVASPASRPESDAGRACSRIGDGGMDRSVSDANFADREASSRSAPPAWHVRRGSCSAGDSGRRAHTHTRRRTPSHIYTALDFLDSGSFDCITLFLQTSLAPRFCSTGVGLSQAD